MVPVKANDQNEASEGAFGVESECPAMSAGWRRKGAAVLGNGHIVFGGGFPEAAGKPAKAWLLPQQLLKKMQQKS